MTDPIAALEQLATMRERALITEDEYQVKRAELIARIGQERPVTPAPVPVVPPVAVPPVADQWQRAKPRTNALAWIIGAIVVFAVLGAIFGGPDAEDNVTGAVDPTRTPTQRPVVTGAPTDTPWPPDYELFVCAAFGQLTDAAVHLGEMSDAAGTFDLDVLIEEANAAGQDAREASDYLEVTPDWTPGAGLKKWLGIMAENLRTATNLAVYGAENSDIDALEQATALLDTVNSNIAQVGKEIDKLRSETGFVCP